VENCAAILRAKIKLQHPKNRGPSPKRLILWQKKSFDVADRSMLRSLDFFGTFFIKKKRNDPSAVKSRGQPKAKASQKGYLHHFIKTN